MAMGLTGLAVALCVLGTSGQPTCTPPGCWPTLADRAIASDGQPATIHALSLVGCVPGGQVLVFEANQRDTTSTTFTIQACSGYQNAGYAVACSASPRAYPAVGTVLEFSPPAATRLVRPLKVADTPTLANVSSTNGCVGGGRMLFRASYDVVTIVSCGTRSDPNLVQFLAGITQDIPVGSDVFFFDTQSNPCTGACFAAESTVRVWGTDQPLPLSRLRVGDRVADGVDYTDVIGFLHTTHVPARVVSIDHEHGQLRATWNHVLFVGGGEKMAGAVVVGDRLRLSESAHIVNVLSVHADRTHAGVSAPLTTTGSLSVDGVRASNYASTSVAYVTHAAAHAAFFAVRALGLLPSYAAPPTSESHEEPIMHPLADFYINALGLERVAALMK